MPIASFADNTNYVCETMRGFDMKWCKKKSKKNYFSCGDLRIYPIREIRGGNRIIYSDQLDDSDYMGNKNFRKKFNHYHFKS